MEGFLQGAAAGVVDDHAIPVVRVQVAEVDLTVDGGVDVDVDLDRRASSTATQAWAMPPGRMATPATNGNKDSRPLFLSKDRTPESQRHVHFGDDSCKPPGHLQIFISVFHRTQKESEL